MLYTYIHLKYALEEFDLHSKHIYQNLAFGIMTSFSWLASALQTLPAGCALSSRVCYVHSGSYLQMETIPDTLRTYVGFSLRIPRGRAL